MGTIVSISNPTTKAVIDAIGPAETCCEPALGSFLQVQAYFVERLAAVRLAVTLTTTDEAMVAVWVMVKALQ